MYRVQTTVMKQMCSNLALSSIWLTLTKKTDILTITLGKDLGSYTAVADVFQVYVLAGPVSICVPLLNTFLKCKLNCSFESH